MRKYEYTERQTVAMLGRRGFLKVVGVTALAIGVTGYAVVDLIQRRSDVRFAKKMALPVLTRTSLCCVFMLTCTRNRPPVNWLTTCCIPATIRVRN